MPSKRDEAYAQIVLTDPQLFGNEAAEDEADDIFASYAVERADLDRFADPSRRLAIARAYKGEGKSALLRLALSRVTRRNPEAIVIARTADELAPEVGRDDYSSWIRGWKAAIVQAFAQEIGSRIGVAWTDDSMSLVEESERAGTRRRNLLSAITDRLSLPEVSLGDAKLTLPERKRLGTINPAATVKRWLRREQQLWLFVDDVDKNFTNVPAWKLKVGSYFDACRSLLNVFPELRVRTVVRPNVWTSIKREYESLSHVEQYVIELSWDVEDAQHLLAKRIEAYLKRKAQWERVRPMAQGSRGRNFLISLAFEDPMQWSGSQRGAHSVLHTLSKHRPRWMIELAKAAATGAVRRGHSLIYRADITGELASFGRRRIDDTVAEFKAQCPELEELITAFTREREQLSTDELLRIIDRKILTHLSPSIAGVSGRATNLNVAALLFEVGLFFGRRENPDGSYAHVHFADSPSLLRSRTNVDAGLSWEIHPVFRQALEIRDSEGRERGLPRRR